MGIKLQQCNINLLIASWNLKRVVPFTLAFWYHMPSPKRERESPKLLVAPFSRDPPYRKHFYFAGPCSHAWREMKIRRDPARLGLVIVEVAWMLMTTRHLAFDRISDS